LAVRDALTGRLRAAAWSALHQARLERRSAPGWPAAARCAMAAAGCLRPVKEQRELRLAPG
jgi:hypothetical protein